VLRQRALMYDVCKALYGGQLRIFELLMGKVQLFSGNEENGLT
jgi:hypothetical protein